MLGELSGTECPDPFADPIRYHEWFEDNKCPCCDGKGWRLYNVRNNDPMEHECQCCDGGGLKDENWKCTGFDHTEYE